MNGLFCFATLLVVGRSEVKYSHYRYSYRNDIETCKKSKREKNITKVCNIIKTSKN